MRKNTPPGVSQIWKPSPPKTYFPCPVMIILSKILCSFLSCPLFLSGSNIKIKKMGNCNRAGLCGALLGEKACLCSLFLVCRKGLYSLPEAPKNRLKQLLIRGVRKYRNKEKTVKKSPSSSLKDIHDNLTHIFEFFCRN